MSCTPTDPAAARRAAGVRPRGAHASLRRAPLRTAVLCVLATGAVLAGCTSPTSSSTTPARVTAAWTTFFKGSTPAARRLALLQDASAFAAVVRAQTSSSFAKGLSVRVSKVKVTSRTTATVTYSIYIGGTPELPGATGTAVLLGGQWKVSTQSFCGLLQLEGGAPAVCATT